MHQSKYTETPIFSTKAHVFHIDPQTKRSWISASSQAVNVNFYYDASRNVYRIISVEGQKPVINSTITPNMTFTKTSQKFGQWSDIRANTVYGLGFSSEPELNKFIEKFQEVKEATKASQQKQSLAHNGNMTTGGGSLSARDSPRLLSSAEVHNDIAMSTTSSLLPHQRSQSLSGLQAKNLTDSPKYATSRDKHQHMSSATLSHSSIESQLRYENDRLKLALAQSSTNAKKWEIELQTLKSNNTRLQNALSESSTNIQEWMKQLQLLKEENNKMRHKINDLESMHGASPAVDVLSELRKEVNYLRSHCETLETEIKQKDCEIEMLKKRLDDQCHMFGTSNQKVEDKIKVLLNDNEHLRQQLARLSVSGPGESDSLRLSDKCLRELLDTLNARFDQNIQQLRSLQQEYSSLLNNSS